MAPGVRSGWSWRRAAAFASTCPTHVAVRFDLPAARRSSGWAAGIEPWPGGVDLYVAMPPRRSELWIASPSTWSGTHTLVLDPAETKPMAFVEKRRGCARR